MFFNFSEDKGRGGMVGRERWSKKTKQHKNKQNPAHAPMQHWFRNSGKRNGYPLAQLTKYFGPFGKASRLPLQRADIFLSEEFFLEFYEPLHKGEDPTKEKFLALDEVLGENNDEVQHRSRG